MRPLFEVVVMPKIKFICGLENISLFRSSALLRLGAAKRKEKNGISHFT